MLQAAGAAGDHPFLQGAWHYARGLAFVAKGQLADAERGAGRVNEIADGPDARPAAVLAEHRSSACCPSRRRCSPARSPRRRRTTTRRSRISSRAVRLEDGLVYTEPSEWHYPPRHALGAVLLEAGRAGRSGDGLLGGSAAQSGQRLGAARPDAGARARRTRPTTRRSRRRGCKKAWARADVKPPASRFGRLVAGAPTTTQR